MNTLARPLILAAILASGGAMLAYGQTAPAPDTGPATPVAERMTERAHPARSGGHRGGERRRGAMLGAMGFADPAQLFEAVDADGDGGITQDEVNAHLAAQLAAADADADGALSLDEFAPLFAARVRPRMVDAFQGLDADGSGTVTADELNDRFGRMVQRLDRDADGALTRQDGRGGRGG
jgi:Ca2+-binding EF-hand superfamily protein